MIYSLTIPVHKSPGSTNEFMDVFRYEDNRFYIEFLLSEEKEDDEINSGFLA